MYESDANKSKTTTLDMSLPDPLTTIADRNKFGYEYDGMLPMPNLRAVELFDTGHPIYLLYPDDNETMAVDRDEIRLHEGIWRTVRYFSVCIISKSMPGTCW